MSRRGKNFEEPDRIRPDCLKEAASRRLLVSVIEGSEGRKEQGRENIYCLREYLNPHE